MAIEMEARQQAPAAAINALAIRCAQLEARCAEWRRRAEAAEAPLPEIIEYVGAGNGPVG